MLTSCFSVLWISVPQACEVIKGGVLGTLGFANVERNLKTDHTETSIQ